LTTSCNQTRYSTLQSSDSHVLNHLEIAATFVNKGSR
jgi:hypothetical protein